MKQKTLFLLSLSGFILCLDQLVKHTARLALSVGEEKNLIPGFLKAFYLPSKSFYLAGLSSQPFWKEVGSLAVPVVALVLIILIFIKIQDGKSFTSLALAMILAGALANLVDRVHYGYVVAVFQIHFNEKTPFPPFNVADLAIVAGVLFLVISNVKQETPA